MPAPLWIQLVALGVSTVGGCAGLAGLVGALVGFGRVLETVRNLTEQVAALPALASDVAYIKGRLDGRQEGLDESAPRRRPRIAVAKLNGG